MMNFTRAGMGGFYGPSLVGPILILLVVIILVTVSIVRRRRFMKLVAEGKVPAQPYGMRMYHQGMPNLKENDVMEKLKLKFVEGEITEEEYLKKKEVLEQ
jgi:uncharacterized membrane protein